MRPWDDPRVAHGFRAQLEWRRERLGAGDAHLGWKLGFGSPAALKRLELAAPLVGFLLESGRLASGGSVSVAGWTKPVAEPEIAVHVARDLPAGASREAAADAIGALGPALEVADVEFPPDDPREILASNIYHRAVALGPAGEAGAGGKVTGLSPRVLLDGREVGRTDEPEELTGGLVALVAHVADLLDAFGEELRAGDVLIAGSVLPPLDVAGGGELRFDLGSLGAVELTVVP